MMMNSGRMKSSMVLRVIWPRNFLSRLWWVTLKHRNNKPKLPLPLNNFKACRPKKYNLYPLEYNYSVEESLIAAESLSSSSSWEGPRNAVERVPKGFLAVYVGPELRRFVIPASYLSMPDFRGLMDKAAEEFVYQHQGGLRIPSEEDDFEHILERYLAMHQAMSKCGHKKKMNRVWFHLPQAAGVAVGALSERRPLDFHLGGVRMNGSLTLPFHAWDANSPIQRMLLV